MTDWTTRDRPTPNILVVDDVPANLDLLTRLLKDKGYNVRPAPSGEIAIRAARAQPPDLILLDIDMPEMNGYQVCHILKADETLKEIPVIFISALDDSLDKVKAFTSGGLDYITKPFQMAEVEARVNTHLLLHRQRIELKESYERVQEMERLRDSFVHMMVHDMRTPLTCILGYLQLATMSGTTAWVDRDRNLIDRAASSAKHLIVMVNGMLDVSRLEAGQMPLDRKDQDLARIASDALESLGDLTGQCAVTVDRRQEVVAWVDHELVRRIFVNLLTNALKFTPATGRITVEFSVEADFVRASVIDTGPGVAAVDHLRIFEKFGQVASRQNDIPASTGLGLTFCKLAVEAHGGRIGLISAEGEGSTFWFQMPRPA